MQMLKINSKVKPDTLVSLKQECEKQGRTESGMIRKILEDYFKEGLLIPLNPTEEERLKDHLKSK
jgi:hypothetical protein